MDIRTVMPNSEVALLAACMNHGAGVYYRATEHVTPSDFSLPSYRALFGAIGQVADSGGRPDMHTVWAALGEDRGIVEEAGGAAYVLELSQATVALGNVEMYAQQVHAAAVSRRARSILESALAEMDEGRCDVSEVQERLYRLEDRPRETVEFREAMQQVYCEAENPKAAGLPFPWREVQLATRGMQPGMLTVLAAETSVGKTAAALEITEHLIREGKAVLFLSLEMTPVELGRRMAQRRGYSLNDHYGGERKLELVLALENEFNRAPRKSHISRADTVEQIPALIRRHKPDLVVVDHMGLLRGHGNTPYERMSSISWGLKTLSGRYDIPILALCQLSRRREQSGKVPTIDRLRDSGRVEEDASVVILVHRERDSDGVLGEKGCFVVAKSRGGRQGKTEFTFNGDTQVFTLIDKRWER